MNQQIETQLPFGITCIDAGYIKPGLACFYLLEQDGECAVIETGTSHSVARLEQLMAARGIHRDQVRYVIPTHVHLDHAGGAGLMMRRFPRARLLIHPSGARHMIDPARLVESSIEVYGEARFQQLYGDILPIPAERVVEVADGDTIELAGRPLLFRHTRGHANHHFCVWDETSGGWFSGDMFGISYRWCRLDSGDFLFPATTPTQFDPEDYIASLALLDSYGPQRVYLTHFGELAYSGEASALLARQVAAYRDIAAGHSGDRTALEQMLSDYSLGQLRAFETESSDEQLRSLLAFDMDLNAQGLEFWQRRNTS